MRFRTLAVIVLGSLLLSGCLWKRMDRFSTAYRGPDPAYPLVINPIRTDITGDPSGAGGIELSRGPVPDVLHNPDGTLTIRDYTAGQPIIVQPQDVEAGPPDAYAR